MDPQLLDRLAAQGSSAPFRAARRAELNASALGIGVGFLVAAAFGVGWLGLRDDIGVASGTAIFWVKLAFPLLLATLAGWTVWRSAHPGRPLQVPLAALAAVVVLFWAVTLARPLLSVDAIDWQADLWGRTWQECALYIALMALPIWLPAMAWLRRWGPLQPRLAGAVLGWCCGTAAAALYALHCRESGLAFLGVWYLIGAAVPALLGALLGRSWLHW
jgi:hypothetical protein